MLNSSEKQDSFSDEIRLRSILQNLPECVKIIDSSGKITLINPAGLNMLDAGSPEEIIGFYDADFVAAEYREKLKLLHLKVLNGESGKLVCEVVSLKEKRKWIEISAVPFIDNGNRVQLSINRDITERKEIEKALTESESRFRFAIQVTNDGIGEWNFVTGEVYFSPRLCEMLGYSEDDPELPRNFDAWKSRIHPDDVDSVIEELNSLIQNGTHFNVDYKIRHSSGEYKWQNSTGLVVFDDTGKPFKVVGRMSEITDRKLSELKLIESEQFARATFDSLSAHIAILDKHGIILRVNKAWKDFYISNGGNPDFNWEGINYLLFSRIDSGTENADDFSNELKSVLNDEKTNFQLEYPCHSTDEKRWFIVRVTKFRYENSHLVTVAHENITERKIFEDALKLSEKEYKEFYDDDLTGYFICNTDSFLSSWNQAFSNIFKIQKRNAEKIILFRQFFIRQEDWQTIIDKLSETKALDYFDFEMKTAEGKQIFILANLKGIFDTRQNLVKIKGYVLDISDRRSLERQLLQAQKMESLGTLAGGIAHDFNNILSIILTYSSMLKVSKNDADSFEDNVDAIVSATLRGASIVRQLLTYARKTDISLKHLNVNSIIDELKIILFETFPRIVKIQIEQKDSLPKITGDTNQIHQVLLNLCLNARDAMKHGGTLTIQTMAVLGKSVAEKLNLSAETEYVKISVCDTGTGIDNETLARIFEPFFTTKGIGEGTGLGLSLVQSIVNSHNGFIDIVSELGKGTSVILYFPAITEELKEISSVSVSKSKKVSGNETILIVEDEDNLRKIIRYILTKEGYHVIESIDGDEALKSFSGHSDKISLVISDLGLPNLDGHELISEMRKLNPEIKVIISSGFIDPLVRNTLETLGNVSFIQKPFLPDDLVALAQTIIANIV